MINRISFICYTIYCHLDNAGCISINSKGFFGIMVTCVRCELFGVSIALRVLKHWSILYACGWISL